MPASLVRYASATLSDIRENGTAAIRRKIEKVFWNALAFLLYPLVLALRPLVHIRFILIHTVYLGHLAVTPANYLAQRQLGLHPKRSFDVFHIWPLPPSNEALVGVLARSMRIWQASYYFYALYRRLPGGRAHTFHAASLRPGHVRKYSDQDIEGVLQRTEPAVALTPAEESRGWQALAEQGVSRDDRFVAFHARTSKYYFERLNVRDASVAEERQYFRNSDIGLMLPAVETLAQRGYYALRMGAVTEPPIPDIHPRVLDYANSFRSPEMDIFLLANCHFLISNGSGPDGICELFRRPVVFVDYAVWGGMHSWLPHITIFRKYWLKDEKRFMTIREGFANGCEYLVTTEAFAERGIELIPNTAEEVQDAVMEMEARLAGTWVGEPEDEALQRRFWSAVGDHPLHQNVCGRIGAAYLRQNRDLIG